MDLFLMICGAFAVSFAIVYLALRLSAWVEGRTW